MPKKRSARGGYKLSDSPFFRLSKRAKLARLLRVSTDTLEEIANAPRLYVSKWKHKSEDKWLQYEPKGDISKDFRQIDIPDPRLKAMQSRVATLLGRIACPDFLYSPVKGRSYVDNAAHHRGAKAFWLLDVANYFPSCRANNIARFFRRDLQCAPDVASILVKLTTHNGCLPQGSPCSPILAYFSNSPMWSEIATLVSAERCRLSIYVDDITISGEVVRKALIWKIKQIIHKHNIRLKPAKEVSLINAPAEITGVIVRGNLTLLPNRQRKALVQLKGERKNARSSRVRNQIDIRISGRIAQHRQVEGT